MSFITLTSDWHQRDYYLASVKAAILGMDKSIPIIDLNHQIRPFNVGQAGFVIRNSFHQFPEGSVHIIFVDCEPSKDISYLAVNAFNQYFISADNGIFNLILNEEKSEIVELEDLDKEKHGSFPGLRSFTSAAVRIIQNKNLSGLGNPRKNFRDSYPFRATIEENTVSGSIIYIDSYGNAITNITKEIFERVGKSSGFKILVQSRHYTINKIHDQYRSVPQGELVAVFNTANLLEIAINRGNASRLLNLGYNSSVRIEFEN